MSWLPKQSIVVPFDFSDDSLAAVRLAVTMVEDRSNVHVLHVLSEIIPAEPGVIWGEVDDESRCQHAKEAMAEQMAGSEFSGVQLRIALGDPGHEIADVAKQTGADLVVIPSHGRSGIRRLLLGSVTERVVRLAHCPILVLKK